MGIVAALRSDASRLQPGRARLHHLAKLAITNSAFSAALLYRVSHALGSRNHEGLARTAARANLVLHGIDIDHRAEIGHGVLFQHPVGVVIGASRVGAGATLMSGVVLGRKDVTHGPDEGMYPIVGDHVLFGAGATALGPVRIGSGAAVGAHTLVLRHVPPGGLAVGNPTNGGIPTKPRDEQDVGEEHGRH